ncbi:FAD-binding protein [Nocardia sp. X0981]
MGSPEGMDHEFTTDFGGAQHAVPAAVHRMPATFPSRLLGSGRRLTLRGAGHSCDGQTVTDGDLLVTYLPTAGLSQVRDHDDGSTEVPAGLSWYALERHLNKRGVTNPVLTDHLSVSVGGTLSVGGAGVGSVRHGMQVDHVERIQLIDGTGTSRWCSRTEDAELFRFALGGLGTVGLIERVVLRTVPHYRYMHLHRTYYTDVAGIAEHTQTVAQREDVDIYCAASLRGGEFSAAIGWRSNDRRPCHAGNCSVVRSGPSVGQYYTRATPSSAEPIQLWTDFVVPVDQFAPILATVDAMRRRPPFDRTPTMLYILIIRRPADALTFAFTPVSTTNVSVGLGIYTSVGREQHTVTTIRQMFRELSEQCCDLGGRPYLYGVHELSGTLGDRLYGPDLPRLAELRSIYRLQHINADLPLVTAASTSFAKQTRHP